MIEAYNDGSAVITAHNGSSDYFRISPSSMGDFFSYTRRWFGEKLMGEPGFIGSSATVLGSCVHYFAEQAGKGLEFPDNAQQLVADYLAIQSLVVPDLDSVLVRQHWEGMSRTLIDNAIRGVKLHSTEEFIFHEILPGIYAAGTYDALRLTPGGNGTYTLRDYKTANKKPTGISYKYKLQMLIYAYILFKQKGIVVDTIELEFVVRPTKTLPCRHFTFSEAVTEDNMAMIEGQLNLIAHSVKVWKEQPELRYLLAQDYRLKLPDRPKTFKNTN